MVLSSLKNLVKYVNQEIPYREVSQKGLNLEIDVDGHRYMLARGKVLIGSEKKRYGIVEKRSKFLFGSALYLKGIFTRKR